ncbi:penicillin-binding transpeptidase domain-containing protein, partial [Saprospiraceae bacterium]|nr:penicillin-binding transpeptidase domain-containing protein [Saprospiraceae bacterium]
DSEGLAPYFRGELTKWVKKKLREDEYKKPDGTRYNIYTDGLKIYTTIDSKMQRHAEASVTKNMKRVQDRYFKVWDGKDPWSYKTDDKQVKIRKDALNRLIQQSPRYLLIKDRFMSKIFANVIADISSAKLRNIDMIRMLKQEKNKGYFADIVDAKWATKSQVKTYKEIMNSVHWKQLKSDWRKMEKEVRRVFGKKVKMKVYDYETNGFKTVNMTPLDSIKYLRQHMQSGMLAIEPSTGYVKAWVGGINHRVFQYDHVNSNRQVGSTFKPFVYGTAISVQGVSPCWEVDDVQYSIAANDADFKLLKKWQPSNSDNKFSGLPLTLYEALKKSKNSVSVYLMKELGDPQAVIGLASNMGIPRKKIPSVPSICLGTPELSLMDMTSAYSTFANNGIHNTPSFVTRIETRDGQLIYSSVPDQHMAMAADYNYVMVDMLKYAASFIANKFETQVGGKTGTTNDYVDGWFMGITPNLTVGTWVGGEDPWIRFLSLADGQGGVMARPTFVDFLQRVEADKTIDFEVGASFKKPDGFDIQTNCNVYDVEKKKDAAKRFAEEAMDEMFDEEDEEN